MTAACLSALLFPGPVLMYRAMCTHWHALVWGVKMICIDVIYSVHSCICDPAHDTFCWGLLIWCSETPHTHWLRNMGIWINVDFMQISGYIHVYLNIFIFKNFILIILGRQVVAESKPGASIFLRVSHACAGSQDLGHPPLYFQATVRRLDGNCGRWD